MEQQLSDYYTRRLIDARDLVKKVNLPVTGVLTKVAGQLLEAKGCIARNGEVCRIDTISDGSVDAMVIGCEEHKTSLMTIDKAELQTGARVTPTGHGLHCPMGYGLLGRVIDSRGEPLDSLGPLTDTQAGALDPGLINPLERVPIDTPLDVGVRSINALLTIGRGQRIGLFAPSGLGKSVLLGMMTRHTNADITVVCLLGERGREVREFVQGILGPDGMKQSVVIAIPADHTSLRRLNGAKYATAVAEFFRDRGHQVLLLMDSLTRYAQAGREVVTGFCNQRRAPAGSAFITSIIFLLSG